MQQPAGTEFVEARNTLLERSKKMNVYRTAVSEAYPVKFMYFYRTQ